MAASACTPKQRDTVARNLTLMVIRHRRSPADDAADPFQREERRRDLARYGASLGKSTGCKVPVSRRVC
jgi:hypothetical protein